MLKDFLKKSFLNWINSMKNSVNIQNDVFEREVRITSEVFLQIISSAGKVENNGIITINPAKERVDQIRALKWYCGYSEEKNLEEQILVAKKMAQKDIHKNYAIQIKD